MIRLFKRLFANSHLDRRKNKGERLRRQHKLAEETVHSPTGARRALGFFPSRHNGEKLLGGLGMSLRFVICGLHP